jgi:phospholipid/cholesterol/gamma-HCH transport system substrate-binding protein
MTGVNISKEFKIGLLVTIALALLYWGFNFLKGEDVFSRERVFYAIYKDVGGLQKANPVTVNGMNVGRVRDMYFSGDTRPDVVVELLLTNSLNIPKNSKAKITSSDLLGSKAVELNLGDALDFAESGDTLLSEVAESLKDEIDRHLKPIKSRAESIMATVDTVLILVNSLFTEGNIDNISKTISNLSNSFENLSSTTGMIDTLLTGQRTRMERILENIEYLTLTFRNNEDNFNEILGNLSSMSDSLAQIHFSETMMNVNQSVERLASVTQKISEGTGSLGMLINNDTLYFELERSAREMNLLLEDIRLNPRRYVRFSVF